MEGIDVLQVKLSQIERKRDAYTAQRHISQEELENCRQELEHLDEEINNLKQIPQKIAFYQLQINPIEKELRSLIERKEERIKAHQYKAELEAEIFDQAFDATRVVIPEMVTSDLDTLISDLRNEKDDLDKKITELQDIQRGDLFYDLEVEKNHLNVKIQSLEAKIHRFNDLIMMCDILRTDQQI